MHACLPRAVLLPGLDRTSCRPPACCAAAQAALGEDSRDTPFTIKMLLRCQVVVAAVELQDRAGKLLLQAAMAGVDSKLLSYPTTQDVTFAVSKVATRSAACTAWLQSAVLCICCVHARCACVELRPDEAHPPAAALLLHCCCNVLRRSASRPHTGRSSALACSPAARKARHSRLAALAAAPLPRPTRCRCGCCATPKTAALTCSRRLRWRPAT